MSLSILIMVAALLGVASIATVLGARAIERAHPPSGRFVAVNGGRMHVLELGPSDGDELPVVLLHGASGNLEDMRLALGDKLALRRRVVLIDRPGHGWSERPGGDRDAAPARQAMLIAEVLDALKVKRAVLVSHSFAGSVATAFALAYPHRVAGLVLTAPVTHPWPGGIAWYYTLASRPVIGPLFAHTFALPAGILVLDSGSRGVFAPQPMPDSYVERAAIALVLRPAQFLANARDVYELKQFVSAQAPRYGEISAPTVIITGDRDDTVSRVIHSEALARTLPQAELIVLPGVGHMPHHVASDVVLGAIERVCAADKASPSAAAH